MYSYFIHMVQEWLVRVGFFYTGGTGVPVCIVIKYIWCRSDSYV